MSVTFDFRPNFRYFGNPAESGGPHGYFGGFSALAGNVSGGTNTLRVLAAALQGKILLVRSLIVGTREVTARPFTVTAVNTYWAPADGIVIHAAPTTIGQSETTLIAVGRDNPFLWIPERTLPDDLMFTSVSANTDGETNTFFIAGDFWEEARLRKDRIGPLIRW